MVRQSEQALCTILQEEMLTLEQSLDTLRLSVVKCERIYPKARYSFEELESFDSLTSKFGRTSDFYTQKVLRTIWMLLHEGFVPFIDMLNKAEKMNILSSADQCIAIRDLRNQISHEYIPQAVTHLVPDVLESFFWLEENIKCTLQFAVQRGWVK